MEKKSFYFLQINFSNNGVKIIFGGPDITLTTDFVYVLPVVGGEIFQNTA